MGSVGKTYLEAAHQVSVQMYRLSRLKLASKSGIAVICTYCTFTTLAALTYPAPFSPTIAYLSALGDWRESVVSALLYNAGCVITGCALLFFFAGLNVWSTESKLRSYPIMAARTLGVGAAVALMAIGIFSEDFGRPHMVASSAFFLLNFLVILILSFALALGPQSARHVSLYGMALNLSSLLLEMVVGGPLVEWWTVFGSLGFVALIVRATEQLGKQ